jgi:hypothetical protein
MRTDTTTTRRRPTRPPADSATLGRLAVAYLADRHPITERALIRAMLAYQGKNFAHDAITRVPNRRLADLIIGGQLFVAHRDSRGSFMLEVVEPADIRDLDAEGGAS